MQNNKNISIFIITASKRIEVKTDKLTDLKEQKKDRIYN